MLYLIHQAQTLGICALFGTIQFLATTLGDKTYEQSVDITISIFIMALLISLFKGYRLEPILALWFASNVFHFWIHGHIAKIAGTF